MKEAKEESGKNEEEKEVIDIDLEDPETAEAATKIQSSFRGSQARKEVQAMKEAKEEPSKVEEEKEVIDIDMDDPETAKAATKIQAGFRGTQARKEVQEMKAKREEGEKDEKKEEADIVKDEKEIIDIDLDDPE